MAPANDAKEKCGLYQVIVNGREIFALTGQSSRSRRGEPSELINVTVTVSRYGHDEVLGTGADISRVRSPDGRGQIQRRERDVDVLRPPDERGPPLKAVAAAGEQLSAAVVDDGEEQDVACSHALVSEFEPGARGSPSSGFRSAVPSCHDYILHSTSSIL